MAKQVNKTCRVCQQSFKGRRDAKTCSATCRKRLSRSLRSKVSDTVVDISNRLESEVGVAIQSLANKILPKYVEFAPVLLTDGASEPAEAGSIPVRFEQSEDFVEVSKPNTQSSEPASLETSPESDVKTPNQSIIAGQFTEQEPGLKKKIFGGKSSPPEDQESNSSKGSKKHHWIPAAIVALIILSVGGLTWAVVSRLNANSSNIQATINALQRVQLQNLTRNKYWQLNVHNMITNQLKAEDTTTKNLTVTGKATINDLFAKLGQINTLSTNGLTSGNINGGSITANNLQAGNTNTTNLVVTGATTLGGPITINGTTTLADLIANGQLKLTGNENDLILLQPTQDNGQSVFTVRNTSGAALVTIDTNGNLTLASNATIGGVLTVPTANITTDNVTNSNINTATIGTLTATGASTFDGNIHALSDAQIDGTLGVNGATQLNSTLSVAGATTLSSTLAVTGATTLTGQLNANGGIVTNNANINAGSGAITSGLINGQTISNAANFTGSLNVAGNFSVNTNKFTVDAATGNTAVAGTLDVNGASALNGTLGVTGATTLGNNLAVNGNTTLGLNSTNTVSINGRLNTDIIPIGNQVQSIGSNTNFLDNLYVANLFANNVNAGGTQISGTQSTTFTINSSNSTADTQDSSLVFDRGTIAPNATLTWNSTLKQLELNQPVAITSGGLSINSGNLSVNGSQTISGTLQVTGATTLGSIQTNGPINGQTISNASQFTGTVAVQGANALTLGLSSTNTGAILFKGSGSSNTLTLLGPSSPSTNTLTLPNETGTLCSTGSVCTGYAPSSGSGNYIQNGTNPQTANFNITGNGTIGGTVKFSSLGTGVLHSSSLGVISSSAVVLGTDTSGSYVSNLGTLTGLTTAGNSGAGSTPSLSVTYGSLANTSVQGNTTLTCPSGTGNLSGTGNTITLGTGGTCNSLTIVNSPTFSGTVQGNVVNATSTLELGGIDINTAGTLSNVAYLNGTGPQTFTGNNKFTGTLLAQNASDSTAAFQIQNAAGTSNLLVADTTNSRVGIGTASPNTSLTVYNPNASTTQTNFTQSLTNGGINIVTNYVSNAYTPGIFFSTADNNPTEPKAGIYLQETNTGSSLLFGTSSTYTAGITNTALTINQSGGAIFRDSTNSTTEYQFQNASGSSALTVDTTNRIVDTAQLEIDTLGTTGTSVVCYNASRILSSCGSTVGSGSYIFNGTSLQTANFNIQSANIANPAGIVEAASGQTADIFQVANSSGSPIAELGSLGTSNSFFSGAVQTSNSLQLATNSLTTGYVSKQFKAGTGGVTNNDVVILLNDGGLVAEDTPTARNPAVYGVATQTVSAGSNVNIAFSGEYQVTATSPAVNIGDQLVTSTTNGEVVTDNSATTGILGIATSSKSAGSPGLVDVMIRPVGGVSTPIFSPQSDSTTAFQIQNANRSTTLLAADTTNSRIAVNQASANYTLDVNGDINASGIYRVGGVQISSSNLSDQSNIALLNRNNQTFTGNSQSFKNAADSATAFQVQNAAGTTTLFNLNTSALNATITGAQGSSILSIKDNGNGGTLTLGTGGSGATNETFGSSGSIAGSGGQFQIKGTNATPLAFYTNGTQRETIDSTGLMTYTGKAIFQSASNSAAAFQVQNATGISILSADTNTGNIDLGTSSGQQALTIGTGGGIGSELGVLLISRTASTSGGSCATGTYFYEVTALDGSGGESKPGFETSVAVTGPTGSVTINYLSVSNGATSFKIYRGTSSGAENVFYTTTNSGTFTDTCGTSTAGTPPAVTTAYSFNINAVGNSYLDGGNVGIGTASPTKTLSVLGTGLFQSASGNSTTAFQIQNNNANSLLTADTSNMQLNVGNVQSTGTIAVQGPDGGSVLIGAVVNSGSSGMTFSGNEITDITRAADVQGDGEAPPQSATGIWDAATNLVPDGGFETNTTGYTLTDPSSSITWARSTASAKFGGASVKMTNTTAGEDGYIQTPAINVSASTTYTATAWINASGFTAAANANRALMAVDQVPSALGNTTITTASNGWIKETLTFTTLSGSTSVRLRLYAPQGTVYWDGVQLEQKTIATPYVDTNGSTASRNAAEVTAPSSSVTPTQGWVAMRLRPGFASSFSSTSADNKAFFSLNDGTANNRVSAIYLPASQKIEIASVNGGTGIFPNVTPSTSWSAGSFDTFVFAWTSTTLQLSVNGGAFQTVSSSRTNIPSTITQLEIGSNVSSIRLDSDVLWAAAGSGTLSNTDAASLNALGNSDPSISGLNTIDTSSTPNFAWNGEGTAYSGTNNAATLQSGITLDDTNIYHSSNGAIAIQGSVNSATAFQVQNASGTSDLTVSTSNGQVAVGAAAVPANGVLTVGTNTTAATGGIYFGTDTNLYRSAVSTLKTDDALVIQPTNNPTTSLSITGSVNNSSQAEAINITGTFTGSGDAPEGIGDSQTFQPSASINTAYGFADTPTANPGSGVTITTFNSAFSRIQTGNGSGAVTTANAINLGTPVLGTLLPGTIQGVVIANQGVAGVGTAVGLNVAAQSGATTNIGVKIAASTTYALQLSDTSGSTNGGIEFGTDTALYRAAASTLETSGNFGVNCTNFTYQFCTAATNTTSAASINQLSSGNILQLLSSSTNVVTVNSTGATTFKNSTNSTSAFQIQNSSANSLLTADTSNMQLNVGNVQSTGTIAIQGPDGGSVLIGAIANSGTGSSAMTFSGNEITDSTRASAIQGDGLQPPDSSTGVWETTTNLVRNGGFESNATDWTEDLGAGATGSLARITSDSKFGSAGADFSLTAVGSFNVFQNNYYTYHTAPYFNTGAKYTMSFWAKLASGSSSWRAGIEDSNATNAVVNLTSFTPTTSWKKFSFTFTPLQAGNQPVIYMNLSSGTASDLHVDGVQIEQLPQSTPYVNTNGSTVTRNAARVQAPTAVTNMSQGWFAERVRMGGSSTNTQAYTLGNVQIDANDYLSLAATGSTWQISNVNGGTTDSSSSSTLAYSAGTMVTAVFSWTSTTLNISINGSTFATATRVSVPAGSLTNFDIGSQAGINQLDGDILWTAAGTGTLTNADATSLNALGNSDPSVSSLTSMDSASIPTFAWNGEGSAYSGSNNSITVQSGITLDDTSLYRGATNTLESNSYLLLQPTTDSTTAYQINNAANTEAVFNVDTVNRRIGIGTSAPGAKLDVEAHTNIGQIINQFGSNDILDLQNNGTNVVQVTSTGSTLFKNSANSTTAFQILDSASTNLLTANTNTDTLTVDNLSVTGTCTGCGTAGTVSLQSAYTTGNTITTSGGNNINFTLANGNFVVQNAVGTQNTDNLFNLNGTYNANNLITNGSFEIDTTGWAAKQAGAASIAMTQTTGISNTPFGSGVMQVVSSGTITASDFDGVKWPITLTTSTTYTLSFYAKLSSGSFSALSFGRQADNGSGDTSCSSTGTPSTTDWLRFSCNFTTGASFSGGGGTYVFIGQNDTTARTYYIDGVSLEKSPATSASFYKEGTLNLQGLALGNVLIQPTANTNSTFQVASVNGANGLLVNTDGSAISTGFALTVNSTSLVSTSSTSALSVRNATSLAPLEKLDTSTINNSDTNGSFENSTTTATNYSNNHAGATISVDTTAGNAFEGGNTGKEVTTGSAVANSGVKYNLTTGTMASTTTYTLNFYAKLVAGQSSFTTLTAGRAEDGATETACNLNSNTVTSQWQNYTCTFKTGTTSGTPYFYIGQTDAGVAHQYYLDAVQFTTAGSATSNYHEGNIQLNGVITSPSIFQNNSDGSGVFQIQNAEGNTVLNIDTNTGNLVTNAGFENGAGGWALKGTATVSTDSTSGNVYQGDQALKSVVTAASSGMTTSTFTSTIGTGTQYQLTFYAKCDNTYATFTYGRQDVSGTDINSTTSATCNTNWQQYTAHWTTGGTITNPNIYMNLGTTTSGTIWVDDVSLIQTTTVGATNYNVANISIGGVVTSPLIFENTSNTTTAFQIQNSSGTSVFNVDTQNQRVGINNNAPGNLLSIGALATAAGTYQVAVSTGGTTNSGIVVQTVASQSSGYVFQAQNSSGSLLAGIDYQGNLTVQNATITGVLTINGHVVTGNSSGSTSATVNGNAGTGSSCSVSGNDTAGQITLTTGTAAWASGIQCTINFANSFGSAPHPVTTNATNINLAPVVMYVNSATGNFTVNFVNADTAQHTYIWNYFNAQ